MRRKVDKCSSRVLDALRHLLCIGDCHVLLKLASHLVGEDSVWNVLFLREVLGRLDQVLVQPFGTEARDSRLRHEAVLLKKTTSRLQGCWYQLEVVATLQFAANEEWSYEEDEVILKEEWNAVKACLKEHFGEVELKSQVWTVDEKQFTVDDPDG